MILNAPERYHATQVELSKKIMTYVSKIDLPKPLRDLMSKYLG
jgi:hypothetical protein